MLDIQVGAIEAADDPAKVVEIVAAVSELPAFLSDQVARNRIREGNAAAQSERDGGPGAVRREVLEYRPVWRGLGG
jgi:hypothetical protein